MENNEEVVTTPEVVEEVEEQKPETFTLEQMNEKDAAIAKGEETIGSLKRDLKKASKPTKKATETPKNEAQSDELDYGQKAYLNTKEIADSEHEFVQDQMVESGLDLDKMLENGYFKSKLQEFRDKASVAEATPSGTRGAQEAANTKAGYWADKGEMPPNTPENFKLRQEVVNLRLARETGGHNTFSPNGIIESGLA